MDEADSQSTMLSTSTMTVQEEIIVHESPVTAPEIPPTANIAVSQEKTVDSVSDTDTDIPDYVGHLT